MKSLLSLFLKHLHSSFPHVDGRSVGWFLTLCFGLTWGIECAALAAGVRFDRPEPIALAILSGVMFIPALSAFIVLKQTTGKFRSPLTWRVGPWRAYAWIWALVPAFMALIYLVSWALGLAEFGASPEAILRQLPPAPAGKELPPVPVMLALVAAATLTVGLMVTMVFTFGEEYGWTGFLLPSLLPMGRTRAVLIYGAVWGLWHAPLIVGGFNYPGHPVTGIAFMCLFTIAVGSVQCALLLRYRSVFLTSFLHASINSQGRGVLALVFTGVHPLLGGLVGLVGCVLIGAAGIVALAMVKEPPVRTPG